MDWECTRGDRDKQNNKIQWEQGVIYTEDDEEAGKAIANQID